MEALYLLIPLASLAGAIMAGTKALSDREVGHRWAIPGVAISFLLSLYVLADVLQGNTFNGTVYTWLVSGDLSLEVGFLIDPLTALMMTVVTFVSLLVHVYTIGYMHGDPGYNRFFSYISLFTFFMLMLVMGNNFLVLFFGWEGVGLVSYLLIGFWYKRPTAIAANLKAFLVNRVGDFGFLLGIAAVYAWFGTLQYDAVFAQVGNLAGTTFALIPGWEWSVVTFIAIALFVGAMGKSAQVPLHVWLPDSMEGPTPISALIHAATMVTAGVFMLARLSPIFEHSETALAVVLIVGAVTALFMALIGLVQNDIKRVIAYSTLSQLGYMVVAMGVSAYAAGIFHLMTHAFFKALLFLGAGSAIHAVLDEQDMRKMGGLKKYMPITHWTFLVGALALAGIWPFAGYYSKDTIIEATALSHIPGAGFAHLAVLAGVVVTALYTFRMYFMTFHGEERMDEHTRAHVHESPRVITVPLVLLALPSVFAGFVWIEPVAFGGFFGDALYVAEGHRVLEELHHHHGGWQVYIPLALALLGIGAAYYLYMVRPGLPAKIAEASGPVYGILDKKYGFDALFDRVFAEGGIGLGRFLWRRGDQDIIDDGLVNGTARRIAALSGRLRALQSGYVYHYAFSMLIGVFVLVSWYLIR
ncbi:NADH:ubiquinone oxidoreductase subunit L [Thiohalorhabdus denitrificans]|uniref:NADH dehydrogenase subunit L n=1 Tax=Thiohalorhabdus denitrificans TaxID=381306 RepID=A0A0P9CXN0_9GAMM|nr:NADH-quinone oxidoreductase subunit L [Thiohalorhabdus denitrificans]KPV41630.1 NADH:ubiquinone oxidoreductase subunit L [Thiohalorhabdus denitrificans]SCY56895.1 NADH dehydrogenase subunit L [Thiohalorhabdus denitrificans]